MAESGTTLTREQLYKAVWTTPLTHLAKSFNVPSQFLTKLCDDNDIPRPGSDFWPLKRLGTDLEWAPLPPAAPGAPESFRIEWTPRQPKPKPISKPRAKAPAIETSPAEVPEPPQATRLKVATDFRGAHPLVRAARACLEKGRSDNFGLIRPPWRENCANVTVTKGQINRALLILDAILRALDPKGQKAQVTEEYGRQETFVLVGEEKVRLKINEKTKRVDREGTPEEKKSYTWQRYSFEPTGILTFTIDEYHGPKKRTWTDTQSSQIEDCLEEIVAGIKEAAELLHLHTLEERRKEIERAKEQHRLYQLQLLHEQEQARRQSLLQHSEQWHKIDRLREFIEACRVNMGNRGMLSGDSAALRWLNWASRVADESDPVRGEYLDSAVRHLPPDQIRLAEQGNDALDQR